RRVVQVCREISFRLEELRFPHHLFVNFDRLSRRAELPELLYFLILDRGRIIQLPLRPEIARKKVLVVPDRYSVDRLPGKLPPFLVHSVLVGVEPPNPCPNEREKDNH